MRDKRNSRRPELAIALICAWNLRTKRFGEAAIDLRRVNPSLFKGAAPQNSHTPATKILRAVAPSQSGRDRLNIKDVRSHLRALQSRQ